MWEGKKGSWLRTWQTCKSIQDPDCEVEGG